MTEPKRALPEEAGDGDAGSAAETAETDADASEQPRRAAGPGTGRFRTSMLWTVLGTVVPGLGLWRAGRRVSGAIAMGLFAALLLTLVYLGTGGRNRITTLATNTDVLAGLAIGFLVLAVAWVTVIATSHLALRPPNPTTAQRITGGVLVGALSLAVATPLAVGAEYSWSTAQFLGTVFSDEEPQATGSASPGSTTEADPWGDTDRINVLVIGGDNGGNRDVSLGLRADAVMVASIDVHTGVTTLFSLPRQTARIPFPVDSPLHQYYPNGFYDGVNGANPEYFLNAMYNNIPERIPKDLLGDVKNLGAQVMKVGVGEALGLGTLDYYVIINMDGFKEFINALGGITLNVNYRIPIGGQTTEGTPPSGWIEPGPDQHLNGRLALWYARGRYHVEGSDYSRMERQRCVINAVVQQAKPEVVLANFEKIASAGAKTIETDIPRRVLPQMIDLALKVKNTNLHSVVFQPGVAGWVSANPPWPAVQRRVQQALKEADKAEAAKTSSPSASATATATATKSSTRTPTKSATGKSENLSDSCAYNPQK
ncbi:LCP family protein [Micropruina sonneratiae]|uniref:LCP family protein n=1 Tax=Micropruina sonneratiae TaxID=2986940 RepID=UPI002225EE82|nr:LCP family protein [Micropruina sp. KQZ13P-5]MCW3159131.1 LCP family protein [Micropruina sp. KQZ13P-5]